MKSLLLLHYRADCNTNDIWRAAIRSGWSTERVADQIGGACDGAAKVRYYGNTLHASRIADQLPIRFLPLDLTVLAKTPLTKRRVELMRLSEVPKVRDGDYFIKPAQEKWFPARIYEPSEIVAPEGGTLADDLVYVQQRVDMINEVRCFCLDGKILTASYYRIGHEYCPVGIDDVDRPKALDEMVAELAPHYPRGVVLDFAYTSMREWVFIEPNECWASGIYGCDPFRCLEVIEASQELKINASA
jgi:hypothetical protein